MQKESQNEEKQKSTTSSSESGRVVLAICTLQYEKKTVDCLLSLMYDQLFAGWVIPECSLIPHIRNEAVRVAYENCPDFTHIMFIDDDMNNFSSTHVQALYQEDKDIIQGLTVHRNPPYQMVHFQDTMSDQEIVQTINSKKNLVQPSESVGMAFTLIKRAVFDATREETPAGPVWFTMDRDPREGFDDEVVDFVEKSTKSLHKERIQQAIAFGQNSHIGSNPTGEDVNFSRRAKQMGFQCYTHLGVHIGHIGTNTYDWRYAVAHEYADEPRIVIA